MLRSDHVLFLILALMISLQAPAPDSRHLLPAVWSIIRCSASLNQLFIPSLADLNTHRAALFLPVLYAQALTAALKEG